MRIKLNNTSGIYQIQSIVNNKIYIGSAVNLKNRKSGHFTGLKNKNHTNLYLQNHVNKYGIQDLRFGILEFCTKEELIEKEQYYIDILHPEFNLCLTAGSQLGMKHSKETKQKMSNSLKGKKHPMYGQRHSKKAKQKISEANKGMKRSKETKQKMSQSRIGIKYREETKQKMSDAQKGKKLSKEHKEKISQSSLGIKRSKETKQKMSEAKKGRKLSKESKQKMREKRILYWENKNVVKHFKIS